MTVPVATPLHVTSEVKFHISGRHADGTLFGWSAPDWNEFVAMTVDAVGQENLDAVLAKVKVIITAGSDAPIAAAAAAVYPPAAPAPAPYTAPIQPAPAPWGQPPVPPMQPPAAPAAPAGPPGAPQCAHGAMTYRASKPGAARAWTGYFCPTPKGTQGQCDPIFNN